MASGRDLLIFSAFVVVCTLFVTGETVVTTTCNTTTIKVTDSNAPGGAYVNNAADVASCEAACARNSSCFGFDWDRQNNRCFLTMTDRALINYSKSPGVDHYILLKGQSTCDASCSYPTWEPIVNVHTSGADGQSVVSLDHCVLLCIQNPLCVSIDWDPGNPSGTNCWIQNIQSKSDFRASADNIYYYAKKCSRLAESSSSSSLRTTTLVFITTTSTSSLSRSATTMLPPLVTATRTTTASSSSSSSKISLSTVTSSSLVTASKTSPTILSIAAATSSWANNSSYATTNFTIRQDSTNSNNEDEDGHYDYDQWAIKPTYVVLVGVGGGCLLLVLTAVVILCQYPLNSGKNDTYPYSTDTIDSSDNIIDFGIFDTVQPNSFPLDGVIATEFEATAGR